jgi:hypothetical protein
MLDHTRFTVSPRHPALLVVTDPYYYECLAHVK